MRRGSPPFATEPSTCLSPGQPTLSHPGLPSLHRSRTHRGNRSSPHRLHRTSKLRHPGCNGLRALKQQRLRSLPGCWRLRTQGPSPGPERHRMRRQAASASTAPKTDTAVAPIAGAPGAQNPVPAPETKPAPQTKKAAAPPWAALQQAAPASNEKAPVPADKSPAPGPIGVPLQSAAVQAPAVVPQKDIADSPRQCGVHVNSRAKRRWQGAAANGARARSQGAAAHCHYKPPHPQKAGAPVLSPMTRPDHGSKA